MLNLDVISVTIVYGVCGLVDKILYQYPIMDMDHAKLYSYTR